MWPTILHRAWEMVKAILASSHRLGPLERNSLANQSAIMGGIVSTIDLKKVKPSDLFWGLVMTSFLINKESISRMVS